MPAANRVLQPMSWRRATAEKAMTVQMEGMPRSKREEVERKFDEWAVAYAEHGGKFFAQTARDLGFTICGPDEVPMPREPTRRLDDRFSQGSYKGFDGEGHLQRDFSKGYVAMRADYQRQRDAK